MRPLNLLFSLLLISFLISFGANAQQDSVKLNNIISKVKKLGEEQPIEKVYLHFDKPYYAVGDTIWFKSYVTIEQNIPTPFSKIVYVELFNHRDSLVKAVKLPLKNSVGYGNIPLKMQDFKQGNYYVRAYTQWMINFSEDYFFTKNILIGEAIDKELITNVNFINEQVDKSLKTTAKIQFRDNTKKPLGNKVVSWTIYSNNDPVLKGKGTTDLNGFLSISVTRKENELITNGNISATVVTSDKESLSTMLDLKQSAQTNDIQFFPEGGNLIADIPNQIAFKAINASGLGIDVKGSILNESNQEISTLTSSFGGMGSFYITPEGDKSYSAKITFKDGSSKKYPLPKASANGISLQANSASPEFINIKLIANTNYFEANKGKSFFVVAQNNSVVYFAAKASLGSQLVNIRIPKKELPSGIIQLTLFNEESSPLAERLVFVLNPSPLTISLKSDLAAYKPRQLVKLNINASVNKTPIVGDFSVSVTDEQKVPVDETNETTILSSLLLTSDLKGYIEKPNYYFTKTDEKKLSELDKLMLTQGYRRFSYKEILADNFPIIRFLPEQGIELTGTLRDLTGMPVRKGALRLMVQGKPISAETQTTNSGVFRFQNLVFPDSSQIVINARYNPNGANLMIVMDGVPAPGFGKNKNIFDEVKNIDTALSAYLNNSQKQYRFMRTLKQVEIKGAPVKRVSHADHPALAGLSAIPDHLIEPEAFSACGDFFLDCIRMRATGLTFDQEKFYVSRDYNTGSRTPVQIFLNNFPIEARDLNTVNKAELESVEIFLTDRLGTIDRAYGTKGVMVINTKKPAQGTKMSKQEFMDLIPKKNVITINPMGYSKEREFYSPKYPVNATPSNTDLRTTIYWNPKVVTDANGNFNVQFHNADGKGSYKVVLEGFDKDGNIARSVYRYKVN